MRRDEVIQRLLSNLPDPSYLEVGVQNGHTFHSISAAQKVAVDPSFVFDVLAAKNDPEKSNCSYFEVSSDVYFSNIAKGKDKFDLIFIDGLHTFDQTLKDLMNAICCLKEGGIIVVDDVMPVTYASSISDIVQFERLRQAEGIQDGSWMGDVYKVVFFIEQYLPLFSYATVLENHGQTVMWRAPRHCNGEYVTKIDAITRLDYSDFVLRKSVFNIKSMIEIEAMMTTARASAGQ